MDTKAAVRERELSNHTHRVALFLANRKPARTGSSSESADVNGACAPRAAEAALWLCA